MFLDETQLVKSCQWRYTYYIMPKKKGSNFYCYKLKIQNSVQEIKQYLSFLVEVNVFKPLKIRCTLIHNKYVAIIFIDLSI